MERGQKHSLETKLRISQKLKGRKNRLGTVTSPETKAKLSRIMKGKNTWTLGSECPSRWVYWDDVKTIERFWKAVERLGPSDCWLWMKSKNRYGYGQFSIGKFFPNLTAPRYSMMLRVGRLLSPTECVLHHCDNRSCVNPNHLYIGTHADNAADRVRRKRQSHNGPTNPSKGEDHWNSVLTVDLVRLIRRMKHLGPTALSRKIRISAATITDVLKNRTWRHVS